MEIIKNKRRIWERWDEEKYAELMKKRALGQEPEMEQTKQILKLIEPVYQEKMKVLDVGCGVGHFYSSLKKIDKNIIYHGVDISDYYIKVARKIFRGAKNAKFSREDIFNLNLKDSSYDIVICCMVLPFIPDYQRAVRELFRVAKKHVFIRLMLGDFTHIIRVYLKGYKKNSPFDYYNIYSQKEFVDFIKKQGIRDIKIYEDEFNINLKKKKNFEFSTYTYGKFQIIGNIILSWKVAYAYK